jgi:hypothetical protein
VSVEFQGVAHSLLGVLVPESLKCGHGVVDRITRTKEALELRQEQRIGREPFRKLRSLGHRVIEFGLKPIERSALQEREGKGNAGFIVGEVLCLSGDVHRALEDKGVEFGGIGTVKGVGSTGFDRGGGFRGG